MSRIAHLSDLHCPAAEPAQALALQAAVNAAQPDVIAVTGDVTRAGRRREFAALRDLAQGFGAPIIAVPGNHDVPVFSPQTRLMGPFARFNAIFPHAHFQRPGAFVVAGFNTARVASLTWNWSLGRVDWASFANALDRCHNATPEAVRILASHHPLMPDPADPARSHTHGGAKALARAAEHGIAIVLHGHLHRPSARRIIMPAGTVLNIGAGTSLCERERGAGSSFNLIDFEMGSARITDMRWDGMHYAPHPAGTFTLDTAAGNQRRAHTF